MSKQCWVCAFHSEVGGTDFCHAGETVVEIEQNTEESCDNFVPLGELDIEGDQE